MKIPTDKCPVTKVSELLSDHWTILIIHQLLKGPRRFCELEELLGGISTRTLTLKLARLHHKHLISKSDSGYLPSPTLLKLKKVLAAMEYFGKKYL